MNKKFTAILGLIIQLTLIIIAFDFNMNSIIRILSGICTFQMWICVLINIKNNIPFPDNIFKFLKLTCLPYIAYIYLNGDYK
jgi:hypothetical protein